MSSSASPKPARTPWGVRRERLGKGIAPRAPGPRTGLEFPCRAPSGKRTHPASAMNLLALMRRTADPFSEAYADRENQVLVAATLKKVAGDYAKKPATAQQ